jgi:hypothetical protein
MSTRISTSDLAELCAYSDSSKDYGGIEAYSRSDLAFEFASASERRH